MKYIYGNNLRYSDYSSKDGGYCVYAVYGEDPNCDLGGPHGNPFLGDVEGTFKEVLEHAANNMTRFYSWGGGGYITPKESEAVVLDSVKKLKRNRKAKLKKLVSSDIERLIEEFDTMTSDEIKESLTNIKKKFYSEKRL